MAETTTASDLTELRGLIDSGSAPYRFPELARLVGRLGRAELPAAGMLLSRIAPEDVQKEHPDTPCVTVHIIGHGTLSSLVPALTGELARHGILGRTTIGTFDGYVFDLSDPNGVSYAPETDLVLCLLDPALVFDEVPTPWSPDDVAAAVEAKLRLIESLAARFTRSARATLVLNTLPLPRRYVAQMVDQRSRGKLSGIWHRANARLLELGEQPSVVVIDLVPILGEGVPAEEPRADIYAKAHLSAPLLAGYAREIGHLARHLTGRTDKCLVVDLDGTLWGGVLGDDGLEGIEIAEGYRGEAFTAFQRTVKQLGAQGVLVAAVSKNEQGPVLKALREHPRMTLREDDFVRITANWRPKHENLIELAASLNLGVDSLVFVDDSPFECGLVSRELPGVTVLELGEDPALHVERLLRDGWFDCREVTAEDRGRASQYRGELAREDLRAEFTSIDDYLRELDVQVTLAEAAEADVARVSQLTLRTNQFNLTQQRLQPSDVRALCEDPDALVVTVRSADRFGDNGLVGVLVARRDGPAAGIENFVLSCRVFSRGIEQASIARVLQYLRDGGAESVTGRFRRTEKNALAQEFYPNNGFVREPSPGPEAVFRHDLAHLDLAPSHLTITDELGKADR